MNHIASIITLGLTPSNQDFSGGHPSQNSSGSSALTEEQVISQAQYLDLVYTQSGTLHKKIPDLPKQGQIAVAPSGSHAADGMIGTVNTKK